MPSDPKNPVPTDASNQMSECKIFDFFPIAIVRFVVSVGIRISESWTMSSSYTGGSTEDEGSNNDRCVLTQIHILILNAKKLGVSPPFLISFFVHSVLQRNHTLDNDIILCIATGAVADTVRSPPFENAIYHDQPWCARNDWGVNTQPSPCLFFILPPECRGIYNCNP